MSKVLGNKHPLVSASIGCQLYSCLTTNSCDPGQFYIGYTGKYALCTSAKCVKYYDTNSKKEILNCYCDVNEGPSVGLNTGINFNPYSSGGNNYVYSLYSGYNNSILVKQTCNSGTWGNCLNQVCKVDPLNPNKAYCYCVPFKVKPWITFQNKNNTTPCSCNNLSGALNPAYETIDDFYKLYVFQNKRHK